MQENLEIYNKSCNFASVAPTLLRVASEHIWCDKWMQIDELTLNNSSTRNSFRSLKLIDIIYNYTEIIGFS